MDLEMLTWADFKGIVNSKSLLMQYYDNAVSYVVWAVDHTITYNYTIWKSGYEPVDSDTSQIASDRSDFETNYKPTANLSVTLDQQAVVQTVKPRYGSRAWTFSHNLCDKTTWYGDSVRVVGEAVGTGDGATTTFNLAHTYVIDLSHGKVTDEDYVAPTATQGGTSFTPVIKVAGTTKTERAFGQASGGDYTINYVAGTVTFFTAPANGNAITADYFYENGSTMYVRPVSGQKTIITIAECMFSADLGMADALISSIYTYNPGLGAPPAKFEYPGSRSRYKRIWDFIAYTNGAFPSMPALGGSPRGYSQAIYQLRFDYVTTITLDDAYGAELRLWLENDTPFTGEMAQITFYGYQP